MPKLIGNFRVGRDAVVRYTAKNEPVVAVSLASNYGKADASGKRPTQWIDGTFWGVRAEKVAPSLTKGALHCFTLDDVHIEEFTREDNSKGTKLVARVLDVEFGSRADAPAAAPPPAARPAPAPRPAAAPAGSGFDDMDDDIPF